jgi:hypothetical protein
VAVELLLFFPSLQYQINLASKNTEFIDPQPMIRLIDALVPRHVLFSATGLTVVYWVGIAAGVLAVVGLRTRASLVVYTLVYWFLVSHAYSYADVHHREAPYALFLLALTLSPCGERLSVDALLRRRRALARGQTAEPATTTDLAMWPLRFLHVLLAMTYFSTGITKVLSGGLRWMNGYTLQFYIFNTAINRDLPLGLWLAHQHTLCVVLGVGTILFETFYFVSILVPRTARLMFLSGIFFHLSLYLTAGHPFFEHMLLNATLLLFLDTTWLARLVERLTGQREVAPVAELAR